MLEFHKCMWVCGYTENIISIEDECMYTQEDNINTLSSLSISVYVILLMCSSTADIFIIFN